MRVAEISAVGVTLAALISRLKSKRRILLDDKKDEVLILSEVVQAMDQALSAMRKEFEGKLEDSDKHRKECDRALAELNKRLDEFFETDIPAYTKFHRMDGKGES